MSPDRSWQPVALCSGNHSHLFFPPSTQERKDERERREMRAKAVRAVTGAWFRTVNAEKADVRRMRTVWHSLANTLWTASGVDVRRTEFAGMRAEWLTPQEPASGKVILYLHGGAYVFGNCATHRQLVSYVARACGVRALVSWDGSWFKSSTLAIPTRSAPNSLALAIINSASSSAVLSDIIFSL